MDFKSLGKTCFSTDNTREFQRDPIPLLHGKVGWEFDSGLDAYMYVTNAVDEEYYTETVQEDGMYLVGQPRTVDSAWLIVSHFRGRGRHFLITSPCCGISKTLNGSR